MPKANKNGVSPKQALAWITDHLTPVPFVQKMLFVHNLHIMVKAGLSIVDALRILSEQVSNKKLRLIIEEIKMQVEKGRQLSEVLADYPHVFPNLYVSMIGAGEAAGKMEDALLQVNKQMKDSHELASRVKGALIYPSVVLSAMIGLGIMMVVFVLPKILDMFTESNVELPLATRMLIGLVTVTQHYGIFIAIGAVALVMFCIWLLKHNSVKHVVHEFNLHLPIAGPIIRKINVARFTMTLSSLLESTIPIIDAVRITADVVGNIRYKESLAVVAEELKKGLPLSEILSKFKKYFPPMVVQMIMVGEQSGQVDSMLSELAEYYAGEVDSTMRNFSTIIEPVIILLLGVGVAGIAVAVIMPIYSLSQSF